jgi:hypothetical protein
MEIDMYASFQLHTDETIKEGWSHVTRFYKLLQVSFLFLSQFSENLMMIDIYKT